jgi:hypothetical protein
MATPLFKVDDVGAPLGDAISKFSLTLSSFKTHFGREKQH